MSDFQDFLDATGIKRKTNIRYEDRSWGSLKKEMASIPDATDILFVLAERYPINYAFVDKTFQSKGKISGWYTIGEVLKALLSQTATKRRIAGTLPLEMIPYEYQYLYTQISMEDGQPV